MPRLLVALAVMAGLMASPAWAQTTSYTTSTQHSSPIVWTPELTIIPGVIEAGQPITIVPTSIADYIQTIFRAFILVVGILAVVMIVYGGIKWIAAAGNPGRIQDARTTIDNAVIGLILALTSVVLLNIISPSLTKFNGLDLAQVNQGVLNFYQNLTGSISGCGVQKVAGPPTLACDAGGNCTSDDLVNAWINQAASKFFIDPLLIKAVMAKESLTGGNFVSRPTQITTQNGQPASTAYGLGQFVIKAGTLTQAIQAVNHRLPADCPADKLLINGQINPTCAAWLDRTDDNSELHGLKLQVFMVAYYLNNVSSADCVQHDQAKTAAAYFLGKSGVQQYCDAQAIAQGSANLQTAVSQRLLDAQSYVNSVQKYYGQYCTASR